jgi:hypothetical protein
MTPCSLLSFLPPTCLLVLAEIISSTLKMEARWAPEPVWTTWKRENSWPYWDSDSDSSVVQPVASRYTDWAVSAPYLNSGLPECDTEY